MKGFGKRSGEASPYPRYLLIPLWFFIQCFLLKIVLRKTII